MASRLKMADLDRAVPDDTTLRRRQKTRVVQIPHPPMPHRNHRPTGHRDHPDPQERPTVAGGLRGSARHGPRTSGRQCLAPERNPARHPPLWQGVLETLDRLPRGKPHRGQDALAGRARTGGTHQFDINPSGNPSPRETPTDKPPRSRSASFAGSLEPMAFGLLSHEPLQCTRHRRHHSRGLSTTRKGEAMLQA